MSDVIVSLSTAMICFMSSCYPALIGKDTPTGEFQLKQYSTTRPGYGGDILVFKEDDNYVYAIHRVLNIPKQRRKQRLKSNDISQRIDVTLGCINVDPVVYDSIVQCCSKSKVIIK